MVVFFEKATVGTALADATGAKARRTTAPAAATPAANGKAADSSAASTPTPAATPGG